MKRPDPPSPARGSWLALLLAAGLLLISVAVLFVLSLGAFLPVVVMGGIIFAATGLHYLVWGWWLGGMIRQEAEEEGDEF